MDCDRGAQAPPDSSVAAEIDVVVPVYGAADELARCLASLHRHTSMPPHRLVLVVDGPQADAVEEVLRLPDLAAATILRNSERVGFVASVNRAMAASQRDVVLLNSDTVVSAGWLDQLRAAATSSPQVATATPLSNNATICSFPEFLADNELPTDCDVDTVAAAVATAFRGDYPELPTGVGVCLYIRRRALDELGLFDDKSFGLGYGEETDFCRRAIAHGFSHVVDSATFIFHQGRSSFGADGRQRERRAEALLRRRHRDYYRDLLRFIANDPLAAIRRRAAAALPTSPPRHNGPQRRVVHLVHGWPPFNHAGTEVYARELAVAQATRHHVAAFVRVADAARPSGSWRALLDHGVELQLVVNNFDRRNPLARNALLDGAMNRAFAAFLDRHRPQLVHVHHLAGHAASLMSVAAAYGARLVYQAQDWWPICARANLVNSAMEPCPGPAPGRCSRCLRLTSLPPAWLLNRTLYLFRRNVLRRQLATAHAYIMGSEAMRRDLARAGMLAPGVPVHVLDYGVHRDRLQPPAGAAPQLGHPLRCAYIGAVMPHKGVHVIVEAFNRLGGAPAQLHIWGDHSQLPAYHSELERRAAGTRVHFHGRFAEADKAAVLAATDLLLIPSIGLESFGIVAREAMAAGVPVMASQLGALAELAIDQRCGALLPPGDVDAWAAALRRVANDPAIVLGWRQRLPQVKSVAEHATEIDAIYAEVLAR